MEQNIEQLKKLAKVFNTDNVITSAEIEQVLTGIVSIMASFRKENIQLTEENKQICNDLMSEIQSQYKKTLENINNKETSLSDSINTEISKLQAKFNEEIKKAQDLINELKSIEVKDGEDADEEVIVSKVLEQIKLPEYKEIVLDTAEQIADKLETLKDDKRLDASAIKNLPEFIDSRPNGGGWRNLFQLHDVNINNPTNAQVLKYDSTAKQWKNDTDTAGSGTVTSVSVVTANGFTGVVADATTTPAITIDASGLDTTKLADGSVTNTEFQYINTLTSNAQTQINAKMTNPMTSKNDIIIGDTGGVPIRLAENNTADPFALISQGNGTSLPISWVKTIGTNAVNGINNATNLITASNPVIEATGLTSILSTYQAKRVYADYAGSANVSAGDTYIALSGSTITATLQTPTAGEIHYFINTSATVNTIDTSGGEVIGNQATQAGSISIQPGEVLGVVGDGSNWLYLYARSHSDLYVPTLTAVANITTLTMRSAHWERVGNKVTVDLVVDAEPSANNTQTTFGIDIPLAKNFINNYDVIGMGHSVDGTANQHGLAVYADTTNDRAECTYYETHGATDTLNIHFSYMIDA